MIDSGSRSQVRPLESFKRRRLGLLAIASIIIHNIEPWDFFRLILPLSRASSCSEIVRFWNRKPRFLRRHPPTVGHDRAKMHSPNPNCFNFRARRRSGSP
jgi:hypothetical protein